MAKADHLKEWRDPLTPRGMKAYGGFGFPGGSVVRNLPNSRDRDSIPRLGRSPGERNGNPLQCSCLENFMDRGDWRVTVLGVAKSWT